MSEKVERVLVQGTVTFTVSCNDLIGLVDTNIANSEHTMSKWLKNKAYQLIDLASVDVEIDYDETVNITKETADLYTDEIIGDSEWKKIMKENKE